MSDLGPIFRPQSVIVPLGVEINSFKDVHNETPNVSPFTAIVTTYSATYATKYPGEKLVITAELNFRWDPPNGVANTATNARVLVDGVLVDSLAYNVNTNVSDPGTITRTPRISTEIIASGASHTIEVQIQPVGNSLNGSWGNLSQIVTDVFVDEIHATGNVRWELENA